jgi:ABC-type multidrug transport system fused ATPase/permease subunit
MQPEPTGSIAYCAQQPWLVNASIKDNILFGCSIDEERYDDVLIACALERDLKLVNDTAEQHCLALARIFLDPEQKALSIVAPSLEIVVVENPTVQVR